MTFHTPAGFAERCALRDDSAAHQIRIITRLHNSLHVSCTCLLQKGEMGTPAFKPIAEIADADEAWEQWWAHHVRLGITPDEEQAVIA